MTWIRFSRDQLGLITYACNAQRRIQGEGWGGCNPLFGKFSNLSGYPCLSLFHTKNNIISYNVSSSSIDHYKKTVAIPLLDSLIIQMQDRFSDEDRHARHLLCVVPSIIVNRALQLDDEVEGMLFWEKDDFSIGHLRVAKTLTFKTRPSAQPFLWKWVLFAWEWKIISISKAEHLTSFWYRGPGKLGNGLFPWKWGT